MTSEAGCHFRALFASQVRLPGEVLDLQRAALYLAGEEYPDLDTSLYLSRMDEMAEEVQAQAGGSAESEAMARTFNHYLFDVKGFSGNARDYYDPHNSFLNRVMDTGIGIPITLAVLYLGIARRLGLTCYGVGMPGHFLVKLEELDLYVDPFNRGQLLSAGDCRRLAGTMFGPNLDWDEQFLSPTPPTLILSRMLNNLRMIYSQRRDLVRLTGVLERMILIDPSSEVLCRDLAFCLLERGDKPAAVLRLEEFISHSTSERAAASARNLIDSILGGG